MGSGNDILDMYTYETNTLLEQLENIVLEAEKVDTFSQEDVNEIFRIMHTIKGSSAMMEFDSLATVAHRIEDLFFIIREESMDVVQEAERSILFDVLFQFIDFFRGEIGKVEANEPLDENIDSFLENINSLIAKIKGGESGAAAAPAAPAPAPVASAPAEASGQDAQAPTPQVVEHGTSEYPYGVHVFFDEGCGMENLRAFMLVTAIRDTCSQSSFLFFPEDVEQNPATADVVAERGFEIVFKAPEDRDQSVSSIQSAGSVKDYKFYDYQPPAPSKAAPQAAPASSAERSPAPSAAANSGGSQSNAQHQKESLISVNLSKLDELIAVVGEIVITESMVTSSPDLKGVKLDIFTKSARQLRKLTDDLQDISMSLRMVPVSGTFQKMNRIVRDMSKKLNKRAKLTLIGEDTEVDKTIVDSIGDPIMHIIRNSMDHGIEEHEEDRIAAGKDPIGHITLTARDTGSEVIIEAIDDGQGIAYDKVLKKAIKSGIASPDVEYSNKEILNFLTMPGFSTNTEVTEFSGRGVGMDVVKRSVEGVGGTLSIASEPGKGMSTTLRIPLTMAIMDGMEVSVGDSIFTIPINNIRQSFKVSEQDVIHDSMNGEMIKIMDNYYPIVRAKDFYHLADGVTDIADGILLWLEAGSCAYCLFVDELIGEQQVVVKQLPSYVNSYNIKDYGINGCTLLGDGSISIILDVASLHSATQRN